MSMLKPLLALSLAVVLGGGAASAHSGEDDHLIRGMVTTRSGRS
jgi:hypothetical protein